MKCKKCGNELEIGMIFCPKCGTENQLVPDYNLGEDDLFQEMEKKEEAQKKQHRAEEKAQKLEEKKQKKKIKSWIIIILLMVVVAAIISALIFYANKNKQLNSYDYQYSKAEEAMTARDYDTAITYLKQALTLDGDSIDARMLLAEAYMELDETDQEIQILLEVIDIESDNDEAYEMLIAAYESQDDYDSILELASSVEDDEILELFDSVLTPSPEIKLEGGSYDSAQTVEISTDDDTYSVYYTLNGKTPTTDSNLYEEEIELEEGDTTLTCIAVDQDGHASLPVSEDYTITLTAPEQAKIIPNGGTYYTAIQITISVEDGATAYYTWDGTTPTANSTAYTGPIDIPEGNNILSVIVVDENGLSSDVVTKNFVYLPED